LMQQCNNFKDAGVQSFGGELFEKVRDAADDIFLNMPPPLPSKKLSAVTAPAAEVPAPVPVTAPVSMTCFHDRYAGCFHGAGVVLMADGTTKQASAIRKGDAIASSTPQGATCSAKVLCSVRTKLDERQGLLVPLKGGLKITAYHPVFVEGQWQFPQQLGKEALLDCEAMYTYLLEEGSSTITVDGVACVSLGHGLKQGPTEHPFFGSWSSVKKDLERDAGFKKGLVDLKPGVKRDPKTGLVCSFISK